MTMDKQELSELQDPTNWDDQSTEVHEPRAQRRAVVSVAFPSDDFRDVSQAARGSNMKLSEFIREAALEKTKQLRRATRPIVLRTSVQGSSRGGMTDASSGRSRFTKTYTVGSMSKEYRP